MMIAATFSGESGHCKDTIVRSGFAAPLSLTHHIPLTSSSSLFAYRNELSEISYLVGIGGSYLTFSGDVRGENE